jgi:hypothetical protein
VLCDLPVEYPKMKPPMETHRPRMKERHVRYLTGLSSRVMLSFSMQVESAREGVAACEENWDSDLAGLTRSIKEEIPIVKDEFTDIMGRSNEKQENKRTREEEREGENSD